MNRSVGLQRRVAFALFTVVLCAGFAAIFATRSPALGSPVTVAPAAKQALAGSVLVLRRSGDHDALWRLSPVDGTPTAAGVLPGSAGSVAVSPDGLNIAYLPASGAPRVWIGYGPLAPRTISLSRAGVRRVDSFTWISGGRLLVSGATKASAGESQDRLYVVSTSTGRIISFRDLRGVEPSYAPGIGTVTYVRLTVVKPGTPANQNTPTIVESLRSVRLAASGTGYTLLSERYRLSADHRSFSDPSISSGGDWLLTGQTGSDVSVTYTVREGRWGNPLLSVFTAALQAQAGWDASGQRTAFAGTLPQDQGQACVWAYDPATGTMARTPAGLLPKLMVNGLAWSASGDLVAGAWDWGVSPQRRHVLVLPGDLTAVNDLGSGRLPVWVQ
jgi:hypothetical protein